MSASAEPAPAPSLTAIPGTAAPPTSAPPVVVTGGLPPMLRTLLGLAAAVVALAGLHLAREMAGPLLLGAVLVIVCHPVRHPLERRGWPRWLATTAVVVLAYVVLAVLALLMSWAGIEFYDLVVEFADELQATAQGLLTWLESVGLESQIADAAASVLDPGTIMGWATSLGSVVLTVLTGFFFVLAYVIFMAADGARYTRAEATFGAERVPTVRRFQAFNAGVRRYFTVNAIFGAVVAVIDGLALWLIGVPAPAVWAILAFVTNFVPNIGFVLGLVPPMVLALVVGGWPLMLAVAVIYSVVNVVLQVLIQPKFVSDAVSLSLTLSFFSVVFWTFVIGPLGAILAIPMTLLVRALVIEGDPDAVWLRWLTGDTSVEPGAGGAAAAVGSGEVEASREAGDPGESSEPGEPGESREVTPETGEPEHPATSTSR